ncbi:Cloroperoxidase [Xylariaceae sp. FL1651]|nr:Cloroperoxidase [Xylariaceae sp. FL1651]
MQFLALLALTTACVANPIASPLAIKPYVKPKSSDSRSPCPLLNTLANHGYLPHDGRNITAQDIGDAIFQSTNWNSQFGTLPGAAALRNLNLTAIKLSDLNSVAGGEHPASLTRDDASSGDSNTIDPARVTALLADSSTNYLTVASLAKSRNRVEKLTNPPITAAQVTTSQGEAALLMLLMRDTYVSLQTAQQNISTLRAPKDRVKVWLLEERFPTAQGWKPAEQEIELADLGPVDTAITAAQAAAKGSA